MQVDFYTLASDNKDDLLSFCLRLVRQIYYKNLSIYLLSESVSDLHYLNHALWETNSTDFIAHNLITNDAENFTAIAPIALGLLEQITAKKDVCINLGTQSVLSQSDKFNRIVEISLHQESYLQAKRQNWRAYQEANYTIKHHNITKFS